MHNTTSLLLPHAVLPTDLHNGEHYVIIVCVKHRGQYLSQKSELVESALTHAVFYGFVA